MNTRLIISPSGNYYGSEQVLHDYLTTTFIPSDVIVPVRGFLKDILKNNSGKHKILEFRNIYSLYIWLGFNLLFGKYKIVYLNEAGHIKYISLYSKIFRKTKFVVHVRILEDTIKTRWPNAIPNNLSIVSISSFIQEALPVPSTLLYDIYKFEPIELPKAFFRDQAALRIGIIGRITLSKGLNQLVLILEALEIRGFISEFDFYLFGDLSNSQEDKSLEMDLRKFKNVFFQGFEKDKVSLYRKIDCVLHCNTQEPLGRIFLESINYLKPFIGFNKAGIGEIGNQVGLDNELINNDDPQYIEQIISKLLRIKKDYSTFVHKMAQAKENAKIIFGEGNYTSFLDTLQQQ